jgi:hypothetical protein
LANVGKHRRERETQRQGESKVQGYESYEKRKKTKAGECRETAAKVKGGR